MAMLELLFFTTALSATDVTVPRSVCSVLPVAVARDLTATYLVGRALPDTVEAGPGAVRPGSGGGHWGAGRQRRVFGQVVRVEQLGGADSATLERAFTQLGARQVIVVPWDYGPDCTPVYWSDSYRWVATAEPGFYTLHIRPESTWVDGLPVLDARYADLEPYPHGQFFAKGYRGTDALRRGPSLTPAEYFALYAALPTYDELKTQPAVSRERLDRWAREHPTLAARFPATVILRYSRPSAR